MVRSANQKFLEAEGPRVSEGTQAPVGVEPSGGHRDTRPRLQVMSLVRGNEPESRGFVSTPPGLRIRSYPIPYPRYPGVTLSLYRSGGQELITGRGLQRTTNGRRGRFCARGGGRQG